MDKPLILKIRKNIAIKGVWKWAYFSREYYLHTVVILSLYVHTTHGTRYFRPNMLVSSLGNLSPLSATNGLHIGFTLSLPSNQLQHLGSHAKGRSRTYTIKINTNDLITGITYLIVLGDFTVATRHQPFCSGAKHSVAQPILIVMQLQKGFEPLARDSIKDFLLCYHYTTYITNNIITQYYSLCQ